MGRPLKTTKGAGIDTGYSNPAGYGVVGGDTGTASTQIVCQVKIGANAEATGYIIRQKGARKFLVTDGTNTGICILSNLAVGSLTDGTMTVEATKGDASTFLLAQISDHFGLDFNGTGYYLTFGAASSTIPTGGLYEVVQVANA